MKKTFAAKKVYSADGSNFPTLVIEDTRDGSKGYLQPFRNYSFQVSASDNGHWDLGSSQVIGLHTWENIQPKGPCNLYSDGILFEALKGQALIAIFNYTHGESVSFEPAEQMPLTNGQVTGICDTVLEQFIAEVVIHLCGKDVKVSGCLDEAIAV